MIQIGQNTNRTYKPIEVWGNDFSNFFYIPILKNANTWGKHFFSKNCNFNKSTLHLDVKQLRQKKFIIFLRDPLERWYSAIAHYLTMMDEFDVTTEYSLTNKECKLLFSGINLDGHSNLQIQSLRGLHTNRCIFFNIANTDFVERLHRFIVKCNLINHVEYIEPINTSIGNVFKMSIISQLKYFAKNNPDSLQRVKDFYMLDYKLYNYVVESNLYTETFSL